MLKLAFEIFVYHFLLQPRLFSVSANFSGRRAREMTLLMSRRRRKSRFFLFFGRNRNWNWQMLTTGIVNGDLKNGMSWSFKISKPLLTCLQRECPGRLHLKYCELSRHFPSHSLKPRARVRWSPHRSLSMSYSLSLFSLGRPLFLPLGSSLKAFTYMKLRGSHQCMDLKLRCTYIFC